MGASDMSPRYDDALPILVGIALSMDVDLSQDDLLVVRDASGRLGIVFKTPLESDDLAGRLRSELGAYGLSEPVLPSVLFEPMNQAGPRLVVLPIGDDGKYETVRLLDRRVVGMDWLGDFAPQPEGPPRLVFGSLKGGVGRSTALAVLAADLARHGRKVLCVDLDLEAPGVGSMLLGERPDDDRRPKYGVLDYLVENGLGGVEDEELFDHIGISHFANGLIHVLPAVGRVTDLHPANMVGKLSRALTENIGPNGRNSIAVQIRGMVDRFVDRDEYDVVLLDARAGISETTASTWLGVGARKLVLFGVDQPQTFQGYRYILGHLMQTLGVPDSDDWRARLTFVQSKAPNTASKRDAFRERLHDLCGEQLYDQDMGDDPGTLFNFAFGEHGLDVPHDATHVEYHPAYEAFDPLADEAVLDPQAYRGPFGAFLDRAWELVELERVP